MRTLQLLSLALLASTILKADLMPTTSASAGVFFDSPDADGPAGCPDPTVLTGTVTGATNASFGANCNPLNSAPGFGSASAEAAIGSLQVNALVHGKHGPHSIADAQYTDHIKILGPDHSEGTAEFIFHFSGTVIHDGAFVSGQLEVFLDDGPAALFPIVVGCCRFNQFDEQLHVPIHFKANQAFFYGADLHGEAFGYLFTGLADLNAELVGVFDGDGHPLVVKELGDVPEPSTLLLLTTTLLLIFVRLASGHFYQRGSNIPLASVFGVVIAHKRWKLRPAAVCVLLGSTGKQE